MNNTVKIGTINPQGLEHTTIDCQVRLYRHTLNRAIPLLQEMWQAYQFHKQIFTKHFFTFITKPKTWQSDAKIFRNIRFCLCPLNVGLVLPKWQDAGFSNEYKYESTQKYYIVKFLCPYDDKDHSTYYTHSVMRNRLKLLFDIIPVSNKEFLVGLGLTIELLKEELQTTNQILESMVSSADVHYL